MPDTSPPDATAVWGDDLPDRPGYPQDLATGAPGEAQLLGRRLAFVGVEAALAVVAGARGASSDGVFP